jgi:hypothetical protein
MSKVAQYRPTGADEGTEIETGFDLINSIGDIFVAVQGHPFKVAVRLVEAARLRFRR